MLALQNCTAQLSGRCILTFPPEWLKDMQEILRCLHCLSIGDWLVIQATDFKRIFMLPFPSYYCNNVTEIGLCSLDEICFILKC